jgi:hypothetical protein
MNNFYPANDSPFILLVWKAVNLCEYILTNPYNFIRNGKRIRATFWEKYIYEVPRRSTD